MTATKCNCCKDAISASKITYLDSDLGEICNDCYDGIIAGKEIFLNEKVMEDNTVSGVFRGRCPDQPEGWVRP